LVLFKFIDRQTNGHIGRHTESEKKSDTYTHTHTHTHIYIYIYIYIYHLRQTSIERNG